MEELHKKLLGTWRSHKRRTLATFHKYHTLPLRQKRVLGGCFGKMFVKYTPKYVWNSLLQTRERYEVIAIDDGAMLSADAGTIVIRVQCDATRRLLSQSMGEMAAEFCRPSVWHIHFRECRGRQYYWFGVAEFCEWFIRVE